MKNVLIVFTATLVLYACGNGAKDEKGTLTDKKTKLEKLRSDRDKLDAKIKSIKEEIATIENPAGLRRRHLSQAKKPLGTGNWYGSTIKKCRELCEQSKGPDQHDRRGMGNDQCTFRREWLCRTAEFKSGRNVHRNGRFQSTDHDRQFIGAKSCNGSTGKLSR